MNDKLLYNFSGLSSQLLEISKLMQTKQVEIVLNPQCHATVLDKTQQIEDNLKETTEKMGKEIGGKIEESFYIIFPT